MYICEFLHIFSHLNRWHIFRAALNERRTVDFRTSSRGRTANSYGAGNFPIGPARNETWKDQRRRQPWLHLQRPFQASLRNLLAVHDAPKGKSVQGLSDGAGRDLPTGEERAQPCSGYGSCYSGQTSFYCEVKSAGGQIQASFSNSKWGMCSFKYYSLSIDIDIFGIMKLYLAV